MNMQQRLRAVKKNAELARELIRHHFGKKRIRIEPLTGGRTNFVFSAISGNEKLVVRISDQRDRINYFQKEQWAVARAREKGIPVPEILEVGNTIIPFPYMIARRIEGEEATHHPERSEVIREMGGYAAVIHTIPTKNYGHVFDWSHNTLSKSNDWKSYLDNELNTEARLEVLQRHKMLPSKTRTHIRAQLKKIRQWNKKPCLHHGDLRLKNIMVDKKGKIVAIIDWENCVSHIAPYWDISIALHDLAIDKQGYFLEGYGLDGKKTLAITPLIKVFNILNYAPVIEDLVKQKQTGKLEHYRARLRGALDMFSL